MTDRLTDAMTKDAVKVDIEYLVQSTDVLIQWGDAPPVRMSQQQHKAFNRWVDSVVLEERERCADAVPTNWSHPMLSGPKAILRGLGRWGCEDINRLLNAIRAAIYRSNCDD